MPVYVCVRLCIRMPVYTYALVYLWKVKVTVVVGIVVIVAFVLVVLILIVIVVIISAVIVAVLYEYCTHTHTCGENTKKWQTILPQNLLNETIRCYVKESCKDFSRRTCQDSCFQKALTAKDSRKHVVRESVFKDVTIRNRRRGKTMSENMSHEHSSGGHIKEYVKQWVKISFSRGRSK